MPSLDENELADVLQLVMDRSNAKIRTTIPAKVQSFDKDTQTATVRPAVQSYYFDVDEDEPAAYHPEPIANCPVWYPAGDGFSIRWPLTNGDDVLILVAERSIDEWAATGNSDAIPRDLRRFDLSDAIVLPGLRPPSNALSDFKGDGLEIRHSAGAKLRVTKTGQIYLGNGSVDLVSLVKDLMAQVRTLALSTTVTLFGPQILSNGPSVAAQVATLEGQITTIKE